MNYHTRNRYEPAPEYNADAYVVSGYSGVAWYVRGWETQPDDDTDWSGYEIRTGNLVCTMVGDDRNFSVDPDDITPIKEGAYCGECGQIGCAFGLIDE